MNDRELNRHNAVKLKAKLLVSTRSYRLHDIAATLGSAFRHKVSEDGEIVPSFASGTQGPYVGIYVRPAKRDAACSLAGVDRKTWINYSREWVQSGIACRCSKGYLTLFLEKRETCPFCANTAASNSRVGGLPNSPVGGLGSPVGGLGGARKRLLTSANGNAEKSTTRGVYEVQELGNGSNHHLVGRGDGGVQEDPSAGVPEIVPPSSKESEAYWDEVKARRDGTWEPGWMKLQREADEDPETDDAVALARVIDVLGAKVIADA